MLTYYMLGKPFGVAEAAGRRHLRCQVLVQMWLARPTNDRPSSKKGFVDVVVDEPLVQSGCEWPETRGRLV